MNFELVLATLAQVSVTLAALSGVAGVLGPRLSGVNISEGTQILLRDVAVLSLFVGFLSVLTLIVGHVDSVIVLRLLSGIAIILWTGALFFSWPKIRHLFKTRSPTHFVGWTSTLVGMSLLLLNVFAPSTWSASRFAGGLLCMLIIAGSNFLIAVFDTDV